MIATGIIRPAQSPPGSLVSVLTLRGTETHRRLVELGYRSALVWLGTSPHLVQFVEVSRQLAESVLGVQS